MSGSWRRYEVLLPLRFNDGREVPREWLAEASNEVAARFGAVSDETHKVAGQWRRGTMLYRDDMATLYVDVPDDEASRTWMLDFKSRWKDRLQQLDLWMISYSIEVI